MSDQPTAARAPFRYVHRTVRQYWRDLKSVYYANTLFWRYLKSGALLAFGFGCWAFSNLVLSYRPDWTIAYYVMAYGFVLILWGPLTHLVIVPLVIRLRRTAGSRPTRAIARHGSKLSLAVFVAIVIVLASIPFGPMVLDFQPTQSGDSGDEAAADAELECALAGDRVQCAVSDTGGFDRVVVVADGEATETVADPPYAFELDATDHDQFVVEVRDEDGEMVQRFVERL